MKFYFVSEFVGVVDLIVILVGSVYIYGRKSFPDGFMKINMGIGLDVDEVQSFTLSMMMIDPSELYSLKLS